jgi:hypothetical protein
MRTAIFVRSFQLTALDVSKQHNLTHLTTLSVPASSNKTRFAPFITQIYIPHSHAQHNTELCMAVCGK